MDGTKDEMAGVVELFGALTLPELERALAELAFKRGQEIDDGAFAAAIEAAVDDYHLVETESDGETVVVAGPAAFPSLPENAADLPHIMDVEDRTVDRTALGEDVAERLRAEAARVVEDGDADRAERLLDVTYDLEAWAPVEVDGVRDRLDETL